MENFFFFFKDPPSRCEKMAILTNFFWFLDSFEHAENFLYQKFFSWVSNFSKKIQLKFWVLVIQLSILLFILFFRGFLGPQTAFDYPMRDFTWFWVVLGKKWGFLKFSDFWKSSLCFSQTRKIFFYMKLISL